MTASLRELVEGKLADQVRQQAARTIRTKVRDWGNQPRKAGRRWLSELVQNALDSADQAGVTKVHVRMEMTKRMFVFEHDGGHFTIDNLAALITGGSSKPYETPESLGQFGTGFLVTHAVSTKVKAEGFASSGDDSKMPFSLTLDRSGDEAGIQKNIETNLHQLESSDINGSQLSKLTRFVYSFDNDENRRTCSEGLDLWTKILPLAFAFADNLAGVELSEEEKRTSWRRVPTGNRDANEVSDEDFVLKKVRIEKRTNGASAPQLIEVWALMTKELEASEEATTVAVLLSVTADAQRSLLDLDESCPRIFKVLPLLDSEFLGTPFVINGSLEVSEDRAIQIGADSAQAERNKRILEWLPALVPELVKCLVQQRVSGFHKLAGLRPVEQADAEWWNELFGKTLERLAKTEMVLTDSGEMARPSQVTFPVGRIDADRQTPAVSVDGVWDLAKQMQSTVPKLELAKDWERTILGWAELGFRLADILDVQSLVERTREAGSLTGLGGLLSSDVEPLEWLCDLLDLIAEADSKENLPAGIVDGILPNQNGEFKRAPEVYRDNGIDDTLKDISEKLGCQTTRASLLENRVWHPSEEASRGSFLENQVQHHKSNDDVIEETVQKLKEPPEGDIEAAQKWVEQSANFLAWLVESKQTNASQTVRRIPLMTLDGWVKPSTEKSACLLLPKGTWPEDMQEYARLFPKKRILSDEYIGALGHQWDGVKQALIEWRICFPQLLDVRSVEERSGAYVMKLARNRASVPVKDAKYRCPDLSYVPFMENEVLGRLTGKPQLAELLLRFALNFLAQADDLWLEEGVAERVDDPQSPVQIWCSEWLGHLKNSKWVPVKVEAEGDTEEEERYQAAAPSQENVTGLVDWGSIKEEKRARARRLLEHLGFQEPELSIRLHSGGDPESEIRARSDLADIFNAVGVEGLPVLLGRVQEQKQTEERIRSNQERGRAVEGIVRQAFISVGFAVETVHTGYDFDAYHSGDAELDSDLGEVKVSTQEDPELHFMVEVKSTATPEARMTRAQARKATENPEHYILCVVSMPPSADDWSDREAVAEAIRIVPSVGGMLEPVFDSVEGADTDDVKLSNKDAVRYCVRDTAWEEHGLTLEKWVSQVVRFARSKDA